MAPPKKRSPESIHDRDRIIVRLPDGMRDDVAALAEANGRSLTSEVVAALEKHLKGVDRITQIWEFLESYREDIEQIRHIWDTIENLENAISGLTDNRFRPLLRPWDEAQQAGGPPITADQAQEIKALLSEVGMSETRFSRYLKASSIENISGSSFKRALSILNEWRGLGLRQS